MAELKTQVIDVDPMDFIAAVEPPAKRADAQVLDAMFRRVTGLAPKMWGPSIIGYGSYHYRYASGREGCACRIGFSPRKASHSLYVLDCAGAPAARKAEALLARLGKHKRAVACLYVNKLADIDLAVLEELAAESWRASFTHWPEDFPEWDK